jgi:hypothetical protein
MATSGDGRTGGGRQDQTLGTALPGRALIASARSVWKVYVFLRRHGAFGNGHTAVGYQNDRDGFTCGGIENYNQGIRAAQIGAGDRNDGWFLMNTSRERMFSLMTHGAGPVTEARPNPFRAAIPAPRNQRELNPFATHVEVDDIEVGPYGDTAEYSFNGTPDFAGADELMRNLPNRGYTLAGNNCNNAVADVLRQYGIPDLPWNQTNLRPKDWYDALPSTWRRIQ